ncbi:helix-turn-helix transcriptional regulator [Lachnospiraceae bacterium 47-T17]
MNMADRIQYLRKTKGLSQEELANKVGVSRQTVSKWESEQSTPDIEKIIIMSELFEVTTDYILKEGSGAGKKVHRMSGTGKDRINL